MTSDFPGTRGYMSFQCDGHVIKERRYYCCKVNGLLYLGLFQPWWPVDHHSSSQHPSSWILRQCSSNLVDTTAMNPNCNCHQNNVSVAQDAVTTHHFHHFWKKLSHMHGKHRCSCLWCRLILGSVGVYGFCFALKELGLHCILSSLWPYLAQMI